MIYPQEIEVWYILPAIRRELSKSLIKRGLSQKEIASKLGITESAISQYIKEKRANLINFDGETKKSIQESAKRIMNNGNVMKEVTKINNLMKKNKFICKVHHNYDKSLPETCDICIYEK